tara:strand:+ start:4122 stop:5705 length:1584 start_codon:yes stop_codon:yes gene_type:complete
MLDAAAESNQTIITVLSVASLTSGLAYLINLSRHSTTPPTSTDFANVARRATRNTVALLFNGLVDRILFWIFWIIALRILGPSGNGEYAFATTMFVYFAAATNFGLSTLVTRELARDPMRLEILFGNALAIRMLLCLICCPAMMALAWIFFQAETISLDTFIVTVLLSLSLVPNLFNQSYAAIYSAYEDMQFRAKTSIGTALVTIGGGVLTLTNGTGVIGLGIVAVLAGMLTSFTLARPLSFGLTANLRLANINDSISLIKQGFPLMLNELLATIFFQIDIMFIQPIRGTEAVGKYNAAYKFVNAAAIIPSAIVLPLFPVFARLSEDTHELHKWFSRAWKALVIIAAPTCVIFTVFGSNIIETFWGDQFLPEGGDALTILMWFLPFSYLNGLLQYILISVDRLREITVAFAIASLTNITLNLILLPIIGLLAAAYTTIIAEILLLIIYLILLADRALVQIIAELTVKPLIAATVMTVYLLLLASSPWLVALITSLLIYLIMLLLLKAISIRELLELKRALLLTDQRS